MGNDGGKRAARKSELRARYQGKPGPVLLRREMIAFLPACGLALLWVGPEAMVLIGLTAILVGWMTRPLHVPPEIDEEGCDPATGLLPPSAAISEMAASLQDAQQRNRPTGCLILGLDAPDQVLRRLPPKEFDLLLRRIGERLQAQLRSGDVVTRWDGARFAVLLRPTPRLGLEGMIQLCGRLQEAVSEPYVIAEQTQQITMHIGFHLVGRSAVAPAYRDDAATQAKADARANTEAEAALSRAETAANRAMQSGPGAIRSSRSDKIATKEPGAHPLSASVGDALEAGHIKAFFLPQISTDTGDISGFQAIPRWLHAQRGILTESEILPAIEAAGLGARFSEVMLYAAFGALREIARDGSDFGPASLPFLPGQMGDPKLAERLAWEFDRFEIAPNRLRLIVPQAMVARLDDPVCSHTLHAIKRLGCLIELAGFGSGPVSAETIRQIGPQRLRIHRSLTAEIDHNTEHQRLTAAIVSMAEGLGLETLAEGVPGIAEHAMLCQLGCSAVQGPAIAAPMPISEFLEWAERHRTKLDATPQIGRR
ncbi:phosphodiesterase [Thioclava sp.]|uniref:phosphodiesterase n=2 Tax=unclassified Thioclava TaxID=2621713 RepID=UPI003242E35B